MSPFKYFPAILIQSFPLLPILGCGLFILEQMYGAIGCFGFEFDGAGGYFKYFPLSYPSHA